MGEAERVLVVAEHRPSKTAPIQIKPGDTLKVGKRDDEWPAFVEVTTASGGTGWVPSRFLSADQGTAFVIKPYHTKELAGTPGDVLSVLERDDEGGWLWCRNEAGDEGWIPTRAARPL